VPFAERYSRQIILPDFGEEGQKKIKLSRVLMVGCGGLGLPAAFYLAGAGIGEIGLVDYDRIEISNLPRQTFYSMADIGKNKTAVAREKIEALNPAIKVTTYPLRLEGKNALQIIGNYDYIVDGSDNFPTRYLLNDACVLSGKTLVYGAVFRYEGQAMVIQPETGPCYRCLFPVPPPPGAIPNCQESGVLGSIPGIIGLIQATQIIKLIIGIGKPLVGELLTFDALEMNFRKVKIARNPACPVCGEKPTIRELIDYDWFCGG
jgi:molybdopterin/thiamine biosynthesis adenylyltransferase